MVHRARAGCWLARGLVAGAATACAACGHAAPRESSATSSLAVVGGSDDTAHPSVVSIVAPVDASAPELCSGTVIAPRVVLTAGHCTLGQDPAGLIVGVGPSAGAPTRTLAVAGVLTYPGFSLDDLAGGTDLGAVLLAEDAGVPSVPLFAGDAGGLLGDDVTVVGFGQSSVSDLETRGARRAAATPVSGVCSALLSFGDTSVNACHGDSGGPLLVAGDGGVEALVAVVSYGDEAHCATPSYAVRVDCYAAWIADVVAGVAPSGGSCADCPPPATDCGASDGGSDAGAPDAAPPAPDSGPDGATPGTSSHGGCALTTRSSWPGRPWRPWLDVAGAVGPRRGGPPAAEKEVGSSPCTAG